MPDLRNIPAASRKSRRRLRRLKITAAVFCTAAALYFFFTGSWFITKVAMPVISDVIGYSITAEKADLSLWRGELELTNFNFGPGWQPIVSADSCVVKFNPATLMRGEINISTIRIHGADVAVVRNAAGNFNVLPAAFKRKKRRAAARRAPWQGEINFEMPPVSVGEITFTDTAFLLDYINNGRNIIRVEADNISGSIGPLTNGGEADLHLSGECQIYAKELALRHSRTEIKARVGLTRAFIPRFTEAAVNLTQLSGTAGELDLAGKTIAAVGYAEGENIFKHLEVKNISMDISDNDQPFASAEISARLDFFPWQMNSSFNIVRLPGSVSSYLFRFFNLPYRSTDMSGSGTLVLDRDTGVLNSDISLFDEPGQYRLKLDCNSEIFCSFRQRYISLNRLSADLHMNNAPAAVISTTSPIKLLWSPEPRLVGKSGDVELKFNNFDLSVFERYIDLSDIELTGGKLSMDILCSIDPELSGMRLSGWGMVEDINLTAAGEYRYQRLGGSISLKAELDRRGVMKFNDLEFVFADRHRNLMVAQLSNSVIDLKTGECEIELSVSGVKEPVLQIQPLCDWLNEYPEIRQIADELKPLELTGLLKISYTPGSALITFDNFRLDLYSRQKKLASIQVNPNAYSVSGGVMNRNFDLDITISQAEFQPLWRRIASRIRLPFEFSRGIAGGRIHLSAPQDLSSIELTGDITVDGAGFKTGGTIIQPLYINNKFSLNIDRINRISRLSADTVLRQHNEKILDFSLNMNIPMYAAPLTGNLQLNRLNAIWGDMFGVENLAMLNGSGRLDFSWHGLNNFRAKAGLSFDSVWNGVENTSHTVAGKAAVEIDGAANGIFLRHGAINFASPEEQLCDAEITGSWNPGANLITVNLDSDKIAARTIFQLLKFKRHKLQSDEPVLYFGAIPIVVDAELNDITWGEGIKANSRFRIKMHNNTLFMERIYLVFNGAEIRAAGELDTAEDNPSYTLSVTADDVELATILSPVLSSDYHQLYAAITHFNLDIQGKSLSRTGFWDTQEGVVYADFGRVVLPNAIGSNPFGRIVLLPFSIIANLHDWLPVNLERMRRMTQIITLFRNFYSHTGAFEFNHGNMVLRSKNGKVNVENFHLAGAPIKNFTFSGNFALGSSRALDLHSTVEVMSILIPIDINGTVDNPEVDYPKIIANIFMDNFLNFIDFINPLNLIPADDSASEL